MVDGGKNGLYEWMSTSVDRSEAGWMCGYKGHGWVVDRGMKG